MEKRALLILIIILFMGSVSADYGCTEGLPTIDEDIVDVGQIKNINHLRVHGMRLFGNYAIDILLDARKLTLTNETPSREVELLSGKYNISIINSTGEFALIKVGGGEEEIKLEELGKVEGLEIFVSSLEGFYPGENANIVLFVGEKHLFLHGETPSETSKINGKEYAFELSSSSSMGALIEVTFCENGTLVVIDDPVETEANDSVEVNSSIQNDSEISSQNDSLNITGENDSIVEGQADSEESPEPETTGMQKTMMIIAYSVIGIFIIIIGFVVMRGFLNKKNKEKTEEEPEETSQEEDSES